MSRSKRNLAIEELLKQEFSEEEAASQEQPNPKHSSAQPPFTGKELTYKNRYILGVENLKRSQQEGCLVYSLIDEGDNRSELVCRAEEIGKQEGVRVCVWDKDDIDNIYKYEPPPKEGGQPLPAAHPLRRGRKK